MIELVISNTELHKYGEVVAVTVELPATDEQLQKAANDIKLKDFESGNYQYTDWSFKKLDQLNPNICSTSDIEELNLVAYMLESFSDQQRDDYIALFTDKYNVSTKDLINVAYNIEAGHYKIWHGIMGFTELGEKYMKEEVPPLPKVISDNIDYEGIGRDFDSECVGKFTEVGYIVNFNEIFEPVYDGNNLDELLADIRQEYILEQQM